MGLTPKSVRKNRFEFDPLIKSKKNIFHLKVLTTKMINFVRKGVQFNYLHCIRIISLKVSNYLTHLKKVKILNDINGKSLSLESPVPTGFCVICRSAHNVNRQNVSF